MKNVIRVFLVVFVFAVMSPTFLLAESGADLYKAKCAMCHGAGGAGDTAMGKTLKLRPLGSAEVQAQSDADLNKIVTDGKGKMPKYDGKLTKDQINDLVKFIRTLKK